MTERPLLLEAAPRLSVIVTVVDGGAVLEACLLGLSAQVDAPSFEVLIPFDRSAEVGAELCARFPSFRWIDLGALHTSETPGSEAERHELYDRRRSAGLSRARGEVVAILEDRGVPREDWTAAIDRLHDGTVRVIGGAVENGVDQVRNWAPYFCDFGRYGLPFEESSVRWVSDVNVSYERSLLEEFRSIWEQRFHETSLHWAFLEAGIELRLSPELVVTQRRRIESSAGLVSERWAWGRLFAQTRVEAIGRGACLLRLATSPALPAILLWRQLGLRLAKKNHRAAWLKSLPLIALLLTFWSFGEAAAYGAALFRRHS